MKMLFQSNKRENLPAFAEGEALRLTSLIILSVLVILPFIVFGVYNGVDLAYHFQFAETFHQAILSGDFYPGWGANENLGYGSVAVRFYPPLTAFLMAVTRILTGDWHIATVLNLFFYTFLGSLGVYLWAKEFFPPKQAIWAGLIFAVMPYHLSEIYNGFVFGEYAGSAVLPFCFLFITRICRRGNKFDVLGLAVAYAVLILTHLPVTVIGSITFSLYALLILPRGFPFKPFLKLSFAVLLSFLATCAYWLKMVTEMDLLRNTKFRTDHHFDYDYNFLLTSPWFGEKLLWYLNLILITTLVLSIGFYLISYFADKETPPKNLSKVVIIFLFSASMTVFISQPVWMLIPYLREIQFPWRWLSAASVCGSIIAAAGVKSFLEMANDKSPSSRNWHFKLVGSCAIVLLLAAICLTWTTFINNYLPSNQMENWVEANSRTTGCDCWWTIAAKTETFSVNEKIKIRERSVNILTWQATEKSFTIETGKQSQARIALLFYPHWQVEVNNNPVEPNIADDGAMLIPIPAEKSTVKILFQEPSFIVLAGYISVFTWVIFGLIGLFYISSNLKRANFARPKAKLEFLSK